MVGRLLSFFNIFQITSIPYASCSLFFGVPIKCIYQQPKTNHYGTKNTNKSRIFVFPNWDNSWGIYHVGSISWSREPCFRRLRLRIKVTDVNDSFERPDEAPGWMSRETSPVLGMVIQPLIGNPYNGYINPYYWVDDHPLLYGNLAQLVDFSCL